MKTKLINLVLTPVLIGLILAGHIYQNQGLANIALGFIWFVNVAFILGLLIPDDEVPKKFSKEFIEKPLGFTSHLKFLLVSATLLYTSYYLTAGFYIASLIMFESKISTARDNMRAQA